MQRLSLILSFLILFTCGCSVYRNAIRREQVAEEKSITSSLFEKIEEENLTENNFFIEKGTIRIYKPGEGRKILFNLKFNKPDKYLISVKSITGIEITRIFLSKDTILVNDRINKKVIYASGSEFKKITGIPFEFIKIGIGDIFADKGKKEININCFDGKGNLEAYSTGERVKFIIDCKKSKVINAKIAGDMSKNEINMYFKKIKKIGIRKFPEEIEIEDLNRNVKIFLKIEKILIPWEGEIEFIPGKGYEMQQLK